MPAGRFRSRTFRRIYTKTPGGETVLHYKLRRPSKAHCANCGAELKGVPSERPCKMGKIAKTRKRPERPYGGVLCSKCSQQKIKELARK